MEGIQKIIPHRKCGMILKKYWMSYCYIGVFAVVPIVSGVYPTIRNIFYSFFKTNIILAEPVFVGLGNYMKLFRNSYFWDSLRVTLLFAVLSVPLNMVTASLLAQFLDYKGIRRGVQLIFKLAILILFTVPDVVNAVVWKHFFNSNDAMNSLLEILGFSPLGWLTEANFAIGVLAFVELWKHVGLYTIIFLANYQLINRSMHETATTDGANGWQTYAYIAFPSLKPASMLNAVYAIIQFLKTYMMSRIIISGGPNYTTNFLSYYVYSEYEKMGFGSATVIATFLFLLIVLLTLVGSAAGRRLNETKQIHNMDSLWGTGHNFFYYGAPISLDVVRFI